MKSIAIHLSAVLVALLVACGGQYAAAQNTQPASPFAESTMGRMVNGLNPVNWKMPKMKMPSFQNILPSKDEKMRITEKKDSLMTEISQTTKRSWEKTKATLNPKRLMPSGLFGSGEPKRATKPEQKKPGFFESLLSPSPPERSASVNDFLRQDKPIR